MGYEPLKVELFHQFHQLVISLRSSSGIFSGTVAEGKNEISIFFIESWHHANDLKGLVEGISGSIKLVKQSTEIGLILVQSLVTLAVFLEEIEQYHKNLHLKSACICLLQVCKLIETLAIVSIVGVPKH